MSPGHLKCSLDNAVKLFGLNPEVFVESSKKIKNHFFCLKLICKIFPVDT